VLKKQSSALKEKTFLLFKDQSFSYGEAYEQSRRIAGGLYAAGVRPGQHIAIMMENRPETIWTNFALALIGAVSVPINTATRGDLLSYYIRQSDSSTIVVDQAFVERLALVEPQCPLLEQVVVLGDEALENFADSSF